MELTLLLATPIAKIILNKFYEGIGDKLTEKAVNLLPEKVKQLIQQLGKLIWENCLKQEPKKDELLKNASDGSKKAQQELTKYLNEILENNPDLKQEAKKLADKINQNIEIDNTNTKNVQNISNGKGTMNISEDESQLINIGEGSTVHINKP